MKDGSTRTHDVENVWFDAEPPEIGEGPLVSLRGSPRSVVDLEGRDE